MNIISEFIQALDSEISALKKGKGSGIVTVNNGRLLNRILELYIYQFNLENFLVVLEDTPAILEVNGIEYECEIISVNGQQVQISLKEKLSESIPSAKIKTNTWYLYELLKKKYEEHAIDDNRFHNSDRLFSGNSVPIEGAGFSPTYSILDESKSPNKSQHRAIISSLNNFLTIIWGPPGTGKTVTIARAIESHLNEGRRILLLSHANNAVDQALEKVAEQTESSYYKDCKLVRLGTPKSEVLQKFKNQYPLLLIEKIAEYKSSELVKLRLKHINEMETIKNITKDLEFNVTLWNKIEKQYDLIKQEQIVSQKLDDDLLNLNKKSQYLDSYLMALRQKLERAIKSGILKRTIFGLNPENIKKKIKDISEKIINVQNEIRDAQNNKNDSTKKINKDEKSRQEAIKELKSRIKGYKNIDELKAKLENYRNQLKNIQIEIDRINSEIEQIKSKIILEAKLIATTLTKSYLSKEIDNAEFDILIVDEISMAPLPMLYWAASKVKKGITIIGDFKQLPPICISKEELAEKWLKRSIFDVFEMNDIGKASSNDKINLLDTQYRMNPLISEIPRTRIYNDIIKDDPGTKNKTITDNISSNIPICLIDTTPHDPWCSQFDSGRFNLISALITVELASRVIKSVKDDDLSIGIITPYRKQARLILKIAEDKELLSENNLRINTIHSFQGAEENIIIIDCVEGIGAKKWSILNEFNNTDNAKLILNVAMTRAESKLYIIANHNYFNQLFPQNALLREVFNHFKDKGQIIPSTELFNNFKDENFDYWVEKINSLKDRPFTKGESFSENEFWVSFLNDLSIIEDELIIFSPFLTSERVGKLSTFFHELLATKIKIYIITLPPNDQPAIMKDDAIEVIKFLKSIGILVKFRNKMHEKIALLDRKIKWIGSLNILSHNNRTEYMERFVGERSANELYEKFDLENLLAKDNRNGENCPKCGHGYILIKKQRRDPYKQFYGCSSFPQCDWLENMEGSGNTRRNRKTKYNNTSNQTTFDFIENDKEASEWESKTLYWSSVKKSGYRYSHKKKAWWKRKN